MMDLDELFEHGRQFAMTQFNAAGEVLPMWIAVTHDEELVPIVVPNAPSKDALVGAIKDLFKERQVIRYVQMLEGWMIVVDPKKDPDEAKRYIEEGHAISEHPKRVEILTIEASDGITTRMGQYRILRPSNEKPKLGKFEEMDGDTSEGRFSHLLGRKGTRH